MQNEGRIVELLTEMLVKQDVFIDEIRGVNRRLDEHSMFLKEHTDIPTRHERLLQRNDRQMERVLNLLSDDVIRYDEILDVEQLEEGKRIVLHKSRYASNL